MVYLFRCVAHCSHPSSELFGYKRVCRESCCTALPSAGQKSPYSRFSRTSWCAMKSLSERKSDFKVKQTQADFMCLMIIRWNNKQGDNCDIYNTSFIHIIKFTNTGNEAGLSHCRMRNGVSRFGLNQSLKSSSHLISWHVVHRDASLLPKI